MPKLTHQKVFKSLKLLTHSDFDIISITYTSFPVPSDYRQSFHYILYHLEEFINLQWYCVQNHQRHEVKRIKYKGAAMLTNITIITTLTQQTKHTSQDVQ